MKNLIIIGAGDWGVEIWSWLEDAIGYQSEWTFKGFLDQNTAALDTYTFCDAKVIGDPNSYLPQADDVFICAIGEPSIKQKVTSALEEKGAVFTNIIHKSVTFFKNYTLGYGIVLSPQCVVSNSCTIHNHVSVNLACTLGHDTVIGNYCQLSSQCDVTGHVKIGDFCFLGSRVTIIPKVKIGNNVKIGAGSVVIRGVKSDKTVFGNPAKEL